ncbi:alpha/beta hydrolase [Aestuariivirga sp.]|jgi:pimeloyl-ACP methyl ester carboxylesterase|uniref:alpha/beta hydrolase n=1 Tax=Aestuariivirga sp. TaxID=2650926 RepID=UPI0037844002
MTDIKFENLQDGLRIAYRIDGRSDTGRCGFVWMGGFRSDMTGSKAETLAALARESRRPCLRFDYSGHGASEGSFEAGTISAWLDQSVHMLLNHTRGSQIVVGSSMGGWLALLLYRRLQQVDRQAARRIAGLVLLAPAADMTADLMWDKFPEALRSELARTGVCERPSLYGEPYVITAGLIDDGRQHLRHHEGLVIHCPVRILQGDEDPDVPPDHAMKVYRTISGSDVTLTLIKGGDHRLSTPGSLALLRETVLRLAERSDGLSV